MRMTGMERSAHPVRGFAEDGVSVLGCRTGDRTRSLSTGMFVIPFRASSLDGNIYPRSHAASLVLYIRYGSKPTSSRTKIARKSAAEAIDVVMRHGRKYG